MRPLERLMGTFACRRTLSLERQRRWWLERAPPGPLRDYYAAPFVLASTSAASLGCLAVDFETTGFDPCRDELLSIGFVPIGRQSLHLCDARHYLVRPERSIPESSAVVHGILDDRAQSGFSLAEALPPLLRALAGRALVAHNACIEHGFLDVACRRLYGCHFVAPVIDTLGLELRDLERRGTVAAPGALRLAALRERYGLPRYRAHDALSDAIAGGELLLAQVAYRSTERPPRLGELARPF